LTADDATIERLSAAFRRFAAYETRQNLSPLYERLSGIVAEDRELLELASNAMPGQPPPNILFAAVQDVLTEHTDDPLAAWYPALANGRKPAGNLGLAFRAFALGRQDAIVPLLQMRMVQTNEVRRSALLFPAFVEVQHEAGGHPLALIEIGPSAGLNLNFDRYRYRYGSFETGKVDSPVLLDCEPEGTMPPVQIGLPAIASRMGIDLRPIDAANDEDVRWLRALIWPEHDDRRALLDRALAVAREYLPRLVAGDVFELLPDEVWAAAPGTVVCLFATFVLNQFTPQMLERLAAMLSRLSHDREIWLVVLGANHFVWPERTAPESWTSLWLLHYQSGARQARHLARCNPHGRRITWGADAPE
jgi:hypothetical protein